MKSAQQILDSFLEFPENMYSDERDEIISAMEEYASQFKTPSQEVVDALRELLPTDLRPEAGEILDGLQDFCNQENKRGRVPSVSLNDFSAGIIFGINWLKKSILSKIDKS